MQELLSGHRSCADPFTDVALLPVSTSVTLKASVLSQVVAEFFYPVSGARGQQAVAAERSIRVQTRLNNIRDAIAVTQWADALPNLLQAIQIYGLSCCQDEDYEAMQSLADDQLAPGTLQNLGFTQAASVLEQVVCCCGELSGPEKELFKKIHGCSAFWNFVKQEKFYGRQADQAFMDTSEAQMQSFDATGHYQHVTSTVLLHFM